MSDSRTPEPQVPGEGTRRWVVYGVSRERGLLLVQCPETLALGTVEPQSPEDWHAGCKAVDRPHVWLHAHLVRPTGQVARLPYVVENRQGLHCDCAGQCVESLLHAIPSEVLDGTEWPIGDDRGQVERLYEEVKPFCGRTARRVLRSWWQLDDNFPDVGMELMLERLEAAVARGFHIACCVVQTCLKMAVGHQDVAAKLHRWNTTLDDWGVEDHDDDSDGGEDDDGGDGDGHPGGNENESADNEHRGVDYDDLELPQPFRPWRKSAEKEKVVWRMPVGCQRSHLLGPFVSAEEDAVIMEATIVSAFSRRESAAVDC